MADDAATHQTLSRARLVRAGYALLAGASFAALAQITLGSGLSEHTLTQSWHRAVESDAQGIHAFEPASGAHVHPVSSIATGKPLLVGERVTLVTPDGAIHTLRVCDPASASAISAPDCLGAFAARAVVPAAAPVPQRSL